SLPHVSCAVVVLPRSLYPCRRFHRCILLVASPTLDLTLALVTDHVVHLTSARIVLAIHSRAILGLSASLGSSGASLGCVELEIALDEERAPLGSSGASLGCVELEFDLDEERFW
ncbi:hypothetical protein EXIGLDRAFT_839018, partial [Exidia glandulosa HHB12029]